MKRFLSNVSTVSAPTRPQLELWGRVEWKNAFLQRMKADRQWLNTRRLIVDPFEYNHFFTEVLGVSIGSSFMTSEWLVCACAYQGLGLTIKVFDLNDLRLLFLSDVPFECPGYHYSIGWNDKVIICSSEQTFLWIPLQDRWVDLQMTGVTDIVVHGEYVACVSNGQVYILQYNPLLEEYLWSAPLLYASPERQEEIVASAQHVSLALNTVHVVAGIRVAGAVNLVCVWDLSSSQLVWSVMGPSSVSSGDALTFLFAPKHLIVCLKESRSLSVYDLRNGSPTVRNAHFNAQRGMSWVDHPRGIFLLHGSSKRLKFLQIRPNGSLVVYLRLLVPVKSVISTLGDALFSVNHHRLTVFNWCVRKRLEHVNIRDVGSVLVHPEGNFVLITHADKTVSLVRAEEA